MRWSSLVLAVSLSVLFASEVFAHGGQYRGPDVRGRHPRGPQRAPSIPCDCAEVGCAACSGTGLETGAGMALRETEVEVLESWGDLARVRITTRFRAREQSRFLEGFAVVAPGPLVAVTAGTIQTGAQSLTAERAPSRRARRDYLWERSRTIRDPLLVTAHGPGAVHVRAWPVSEEAETVVTLEGFVLVPDRDASGVRVYRTGTRCLVVRPLTSQSRLQADFVDETGRRAVRVLPRSECQRLYPEAHACAADVPCVPALHDVISQAGDTAVSKDTALVALPPGRRAPENLFVGPRDEVPLLVGPLGDPPSPAPPAPPPVEPTPARQPPPHSDPGAAPPTSE